MATLNIDVLLNDHTAAGFKRLREELRQLQQEANRAVRGDAASGQRGAQQQAASERQDRVAAQRVRNHGRLIDGQNAREVEQIRAKGNLQAAEAAKETARINNRGTQLAAEAMLEEQRIRNRGRQIDAQSRETKARIAQDTALAQGQNRKEIALISERMSANTRASMVREQELKNERKLIEGNEKRRTAAAQSELDQSNATHSARLRQDLEQQRSDNRIREQQEKQRGQDKSRREAEDRRELRRVRRLQDARQRARGAENRRVGSFFGRGDIVGVAGAFADATLAIEGFGFALAAVGHQIIGTATEFERLSRGLAAISGSAAVADRDLRNLREIAELPGIEFTPSIRSFNRLIAGGIDTDAATRIIREFGNAAAIAGGTIRDQSESIRQLQQIRSIGRFTSENLNVILERLPTTREAFQAEFGTVVGGEIQKIIDRQGRTVTEAFESILTRLERQPRAPADTLTNILSNLNNAIDDFSRETGKNLIPVIKELVKALTAILRFLSSSTGQLLLGTVTAGLVGRGVQALGGLAGRGITRLRGGGRASGAGGLVDEFGTEALVGASALGGFSAFGRGIGMANKTARTLRQRSQGKTGADSIIDQIFADVQDRRAANRVAQAVFEGQDLTGPLNFDTLPRATRRVRFSGRIGEAIGSGIGRIGSAFGNENAIRGGAVRGRIIGATPVPHGAAVLGAATFGILALRFKQLQDEADEITRKAEAAAVAQADFVTRVFGSRSDQDLLDGFYQNLSRVNVEIERIGDSSEGSVENLERLFRQVQQGTAEFSDFRITSTLQFDETAVGAAEQLASVARQADETNTYFTALEEQIRLIEKADNERLAASQKQTEQQRNAIRSEGAQYAQLRRQLQGIQGIRTGVRAGAADRETARRTLEEFRAGLRIDQEILEGSAFTQRERVRLSKLTVDQLGEELGRRKELLDTRVEALKTGQRETDQIYRQITARKENNAEIRKQIRAQKEQIDEQLLYFQATTAEPTIEDEIRREGFGPQRAPIGFEGRLPLQGPVLQERPIAPFERPPSLQDIELERIRRAAPGPAAPIGSTTTPFLLTQPFPRGLGGGGLNEDSIFNPEYARAVDVQLKNLSESWTTLRSQVNEFIQERGFSAIFNRNDLAAVYQLRQELTDVNGILSKLQRLEQEAVEGLAALDPEVDTAQVESLEKSLIAVRKAIDEVQQRLDRLNGSIEGGQGFIRLQFAFQNISEHVTRAQAGIREFGRGRQGLGPLFEFLQQNVNLPAARQRRRNLDIQNQQQQRQRVESFLGNIGNQAYEQFGSDILLDALGIGGRSSDQLSDALSDLRRQFRDVQQEIRNDTTISEQARLDELLDLNKRYLQDRRELERQAEEARARAWRDYVKQVVSDFGRLLYEQSQLRLAERASGFLLDKVPFLRGGGSGAGAASGGGSGGLFGLGKLFGGGSGGGATAGSAAGTGVGVGTAATAGVTLASAAVAVNGLIDPIKDVLNSFGFHNPMNDEYAYRQAAEAGRRMFGGQTASQYGRQSAQDLVDNLTAGLEAGAQGGGGPQVVQIMLNDRVLQEVRIREDTMRRQGRTM